MTTISLTYNENNSMARKAINYILSLGLFKATEMQSPSRKKTLKAIKDAQENKGLTTCETFEDYLNAVKE